MLSRRRFTIACGVGVLGLAATGCGAPPRPAGGPGSRFEKLVVIGDPDRNGIFDVSVEYGPDGTGWLAYSRVELPKYVSTHLARSDDRGRSWTYVGAINRSRDDTITADGRAVSGARRYETPTLVHDPGDDPARHWKLYVERYVAVPPHRPDNNLHGDGWIEVKYARRPDGPWSEAVRLFGGPASGSRIDLNRLHPDLGGMSFYNEIGSIALDGALYLSLDASPTPSGLGDWENRKIVLISSHDHGATWRYAGTLTDHDDASDSGYLVLTGSSLVKEGSRLFLLVTPSGAKGLGRRNRGHDGTWIVEFENIARARLKRDAAGRLVVLRRIPIDRDTGGLSDYHEQNIHGGILFPQIDTRTRPDVFQTYMTGQRIVFP
ncbi:MAG: exo-alpha-sialidase [Inquilinus sp.]|nr:exo-alpha-sialidase [Inquilinus sp.]